MKLYIYLATERSEDMKLLEDEIKKRLFNFHLAEIGRTCNMLELTCCLSKDEGDISEVWHIQSPFRILYDNHIMTSDRDMYIPHNKDDETFAYYSSKRNSEFDFIVNNKIHFINDIIVTNVTISPYGDASIEMWSVLIMPLRMMTKIGDFLDIIPQYHILFVIKTILSKSKLRTTI